MNFLLRNRNRFGRQRDSSVRPVFVVMGIMALLVIVVALTGWGVPTRIVIEAGRPVWKTEAAAGGFWANFASYFTSRNALIAENDALHAELLSREVAQTRLGILQKENSEFRITLGRAGKAELILAPVLHAPGDSPYDTFVLDGGTRQGIREGDTVTLDGVIAVGTIEKAYPSSSVARLISTPGNEVSVIIDGVKGPAKAIGKGNGNFVITLPRDLEIEVGAKIYLPGLEKVQLGQVGNIESDVVQAFQTILFALPIHVQGIEQFYILSNPETAR